MSILSGQVSLPSASTFGSWGALQRKEFSLDYQPAPGPQHLNGATAD